MEVTTLIGEECYSSENCNSLCATEELIISKLISIEGRISSIETSMSWFKFITRGGVITIAGFLGINIVGLV